MVILNLGENVDIGQTPSQDLLKFLFLLSRSLLLRHVSDQSSLCFAGCSFSLLGLSFLKLDA